MASRGETLESFLKKNNLDKYSTKFHDEGVFDIQDVLKVDRGILVQEIGMTRLEANKLMREIGKKFEQEPSTVTLRPNPLSDRFKVQNNKAELKIQYQLFTNLAPETKRIGPFNTDQLMYCDLVNIICNAERSELGEDLTVELYTCEGYPLACRPTSYISKLSDWCLEEYPGVPLLYAVPRLKCYTEKLVQYMTAGPLCDGVDSIFIRNVESGFDIRQITTDCQRATYFQLIKRIQDMTGIPGHLIQIYQNCNLIYSSFDVTLIELNIANQSALEIKPIDKFWTPGKDKNFCLNECKPTWYYEQRTYGSTFFFGCLYSLAHWMAESEQKKSGILLKTLGHIRSITGCPPLIHALNLLFSRETITLPHRIAIQECLILLFKLLKPQTPKMHHHDFEVKERITEFSSYFWVYLIERSTPGHLQTEQYSKFKLTCDQTFCRLINPVLVKDVKGVDLIVDRSALSSVIPLDKELVDLFNYKRMSVSFNGDEAIVWNCTTVPTCAVDLTAEWKDLVNKCENYPVLCIQAPLNVKSSKCPRPCMIPNASGNIGVYIDSSRDLKRPHIYFEVSTGKSILFDAQDLDREIKSKQPPCFKKVSLLHHGKEIITRHPEEIIMVILNTSDSVYSVHIDGKKYYQLVIEAFNVFCERATAHDMNYPMGLTVFTKKCILQYPFSNSFREFNNHFDELIPGSYNAIYDAIEFAVEEFDDFTARYQEYREVPRRILCITCEADNASVATALEVTQLLINNKVIMDCVQLCDPKLDTHAIAKASGGYSFKPENSNKLLTIFQQETMLSMKCRKDRTASFAPEGELKLMAELNKPFDIEPCHIQQENIQKRVQTAQSFHARALIRRQLASDTNTDQTKRILQELSYYQTNPHPAIEVFLGEENIKFWRIIMEGPDGTPYKGGIFELFIEFLEDYPARAPNIHFITPIYHCNINSSGRILHAILDRFYAPGVHVREIFNHVYGLLIDPQPDDPLDSVKAIQLRCHRDVYIQNARDYTQQHAMCRTKKQVRIDILGSEQNIQVNYLAHLVCPLTLELFEDPVITPDGETYERKAIVEHLWSGKNYDPFSYRELHEYDLRPNKAVKRAVAEFKQEIERAGQL